MAKKFSKDTAVSMLKEIESLKEDASSAYLLRKDEQLENLAFYLGFQHVVMGGQFVDDGLGECLEQRNIIRPIVRAATATLLKQKINPEVPSVHGDQKARAMADSTEMLCKSFLNTGVFDYDEIRSCIDWSRIIGMGFVKVCWNMDGGRPLDTPAFSEDSNETNEFGEPLVEAFAEGEVSVEFVPTTDLLIDPSIRSKKEMRRSGAYVIHRKLMPVRVLEDRFPKDMFDEPTEGKFCTSSSASVDGTSGLEGTFARNNSSSANDGNVLAEICEFWENPSRKYPTGRLCIFSGQVIIYLGPNIYTPARLPFVPLKGDNNVPGALFAAGAVADLKPLQRTINRVAAKQREWLDSILHARVWSPIGSGVDPESLTNISGQIVEYNKGYLPEVDRPPDIPNSMFNYIADLEIAAKKTSGYDDVAQGTAPPNLSTGRAIAFAKENNEQMRMPEQMEYTQFSLEVLQHCLHVAKQFYNEGRMIRVMGDEGKWLLKEFTTSDFDFGNDIVIEVFSGGPSSHALRFSETLEMFQAGLLTNDTPGAKEARSILNDDSLNKVAFDKSPEARAKARRHILTVLKTPEQEIFVNAWDDLEEYLAVVNRWRQTVEYEELDSYRKKLIDTAAEQAEYFLGLQVQQVGADNQTLQSGAPPAGPPPPAEPGLESPPDGGNSVYPESGVGSQAELVASETGDAAQLGLVGGQ
jgi:hypothetical protein